MQHKKYREQVEKLISEQNQDGFWTGELSDSALSTAVAIVALKIAGFKNDESRIDTGYSWLRNNINSDGGYGDTRDSLSNVSTTLLCYSAVSYCQTGGDGEVILKSMEKWLSGQGISLDPATITKSVLKFYGSDYTFSIPILSMLIVCGVIPLSSAGKIPGLPFELTLLPASLYRFFNMRVVSYALPALIGVGIYLHRTKGSKKLLKGKIRDSFVNPAIRKLDSLLPESGGFLEAIPLTGFVAMCLIASGETENKTVGKGIEFLRNQQREDGGWPIDTDLSTWVTTLSVKALGSEIKFALPVEKISRLRNHLLGLQYKKVHPFNGAKPGGWGWTSFSGSVPDADDTPGAILALLEMYAGTREEITAINNGCKWLADIQNSDGGFPTFCKGWGRLPFDKSCADLTGHALLAMIESSAMLKDNIPQSSQASVKKSIDKAIHFLEKHQSKEGAWLPLWFGNQLTEGNTNPVYGTAKVCVYLSDCLQPGIDNRLKEKISAMVSAAGNFLLNQQNKDGSWGGSIGVTGTIEETSLAICALAGRNDAACLRGFNWLDSRDEIKASPIGLYFALLWYDEKLYPLIYYIEALRRFLDHQGRAVKIIPLAR